MSALSALIVAPAPSFATDRSVWDLVSQHTDVFEQLILATGYTHVLSECGNGSDQIAAFIPLDLYVNGYLESQDKTMAEYLGDPAQASAFIADHMVNGHLDPEALIARSLTHLVTWSGRKLVKEISVGFEAELGVNVLINGQFIIHYARACNGVVYFLHGDTYRTASVRAVGSATEPANFLGSPQGAQAPSRPAFYEANPEISELPDTL